MRIEINDDYVRVNTTFYYRGQGDTCVEPEKTCRDFGGMEGTNGEHYDFACTACGYCYDICEPNYCPNCGARVID